MALVGLLPLLGKPVAVEKSVDVAVSVGLQQQVAVCGERESPVGVENGGNFDLEH